MSYFGTVKLKDEDGTAIDPATSDAELTEGSYSKGNVTDRLTHELLTEMLDVLKRIEYHLSMATDVYPEN